VHRGAPADAGVPVGAGRPDRGQVEVVLTCPTCEERVTVTVLSARTARRERIRNTLLCTALLTATLVGGIWALMTGAVPDVAGLVVFIVGGLALIGVIESSMTMDDGVRLGRSRSHDLDRPGWRDAYDIEG
jgi:hypothetical protein